MSFLTVSSNDLSLGDKIYFSTDKKPFTVKATNEQFTILTKPFNLKQTVLYTIIDWQRGYRNRNNMLFNPYDYAIQEDIDQCLKDLCDPNSVVKVSRRGKVELDIIKIIKAKEGYKRE